MCLTKQQQSLWFLLLLVLFFGVFYVTNVLGKFIVEKKNDSEKAKKKTFTENIETSFVFFQHLHTIYLLRILVFLFVCMLVTLASSSLLADGKYMKI